MGGEKYEYLHLSLLKNWSYKMRWHIYTVFCFGFCFFFFHVCCYAVLLFFIFWSGFFWFCSFLLKSSEKSDFIYNLKSLYCLNQVPYCDQQKMLPFLTIHPSCYEILKLCTFYSFQLFLLPSFLYFCPYVYF